MARKFLWFIAIVVMLIIAVLTALRLFGEQLSRIAFVPTTPFTQMPAQAPNAYADKAMWIARPDVPGNPALWRPKGLEEDGDAPGAAVFFIHPTSYLDRKSWNAPLDNAEANERAAIFVRGQASVFNKTPNVWIPRYRQATLGAFLTPKPEGQKALDTAFRDVLAAFDAFVAAQKPETPIILAGHSQGGFHLSRLLKERVAGAPLAKRIIAAYVIGWPVPLTADLPAMGLPACAAPDQTGCILSWQSFAEPAGYEGTMTLFEAAPSLTGKPRAGDRYLCTNPLTGTAGGAAPASANQGMLKNKADFSDGELVRGGAPARCDAKGFLLIGEGPDLGPYVLPNNNYHVYDYSLFWRNIRADVERRTRAFVAK